MLGGRSEYDNGNMDGWLRTAANDVFSIGYYEEADLPFFGALARNYTTLDNYFSSILGPTFPNRVFQHAAQTDRLSNTIDLCRLPTIWDNLAAAGVSGKYYYPNVPVLAFWGPKYLRISALLADFLVLPTVTAPLPTPCGLFHLGSKIDNESYDFFKLLLSDLVSGWRTLGLPERATEPNLPPS